MAKLTIVNELVSLIPRALGAAITPNKATKPRSNLNFQTKGWIALTLTNVMIACSWNAHSMSEFVTCVQTLCSVGG
jgi:hypothetical protein